MRTRRHVLRHLGLLASVTALAACGGPVTATPLTNTTGMAPVTPSPAPATTLPTIVTASPAAVATAVIASVTPAPMITVPASGNAPSATPLPAASPAGRLLPLFDAHLHYSQDAWDSMPVDRAVALLDAVGTRRALLSSTPDEGTLRLYRADPDRILPILRPYRTRDDMGSWHSDPTIPAYLEERLSLGVHRGLGEFHVYGDAAGSPVMTEVVRLATARGLLLHAHSDEVAVTRLFATEPAAKVLWAHAGFVGPEAVREMVDRYPGLSVEFAIRSDIGPGGRLMPGWRALIERYPERFMIGTDTYVPSRWAAMPAILAGVQAWLMTLPLALAAAVAWGNAARLLGVDAAVFQP